MEAIQLQCGDSTLTVFPAIGAAIGDWRWRQRSLLQAFPGNTGVDAIACFPLVPFANRIALGLLPGEPALTPHVGEAHSLHGVGWQRPWHVLERNAAHLVLGLRHAAGPAWPFDFSATLTIALGGSWLMQTLTVTNLAGRAMPAGLGFHPFFPAGADTVLSTGWDGVWDVSDDHLPLGFRAQLAPDDIAVGGWRVNNCFTGWCGRALLSYPGYKLLISADPACGYLQCYRPADSGFIAIEPVTHIPNAHQLRGDGVSAHGLRDLQPGATLSAWMTLQASL
ncbi:aldose 1-epimerase [Duganella sp. CF517]|uniref:aldose 1-epimerase n=1 Tax=Duganella sp. CF517 TaxID=1881038 RepID=UPI0008C1959D|nr:aldose 1-epimerase [Duganella sp. CF517]SEN10321.1 aldose 1-epimerase [Duganella sp. CF517]